MTEVMNVSSGSRTRAERVLSNLNNEFPFIIHGIKYNCIEIPLQMIMHPMGSLERKEILNLSGPDSGKKAKAYGRYAKRDNVYWDGKVIQFGSPEHLAVLDSFIRAKFKQNKEAMEILLSTEGMEITHEIGPENPKTSLPKEKFCEILTRIREEN